MAWLAEKRVEIHDGVESATLSVPAIDLLAEGIRCLKDSNFQAGLR